MAMASMVVSKRNSDGTIAGRIPALSCFLMIRLRKCGFAQWQCSCRRMTMRRRDLVPPQWDIRAIGYRSIIRKMCRMCASDVADDRQC